MLDVPWLNTVVSLKSKMSKQLKKPKPIWVEPVFTAGIPAPRRSRPKDLLREFVQGAQGNRAFVTPLTWHDQRN
jgi:hypothetical protein